MNKKTARDADLEKTRVLVRVDFNVPLKTLRDAAKTRGAASRP